MVAARSSLAAVVAVASSSGIVAGISLPTSDIATDFITTPAWCLKITP